MAQIQSPETYVDGQQVTAARLNNQTNGAVLLPGAVTDQTAIAGGVASADTLIVHDASTSALRKATASELLGGGIPVVASSVTATDSVTTPELKAAANGDVKVIPYDGIAVTGKTFASVAGTSVTINSTAHGLIAGQVITVTASVAAYSGTFKITSVTTDEIVYTLTVAATPASGSCDYTKEGSQRVAGNLTVEGNNYVSGNSSVDGNLSVSGNLSNTGVANFTGSFQLNGTAGYALYEVFEANVSYSNAAVPVGWNPMYTSPSLTKPSDEIWIIESDLRWRHTLGLIWAVRLNLTTPSTMLNGTIDIEGGGSDYWHIESNIMRYVFNTGTAFTSTITIDVLPSSVAGYAFYCGETNYTTAGTAITALTFSPSKFRIYKYKTA